MNVAASDDAGLHVLLHGNLLICGGSGPADDLSCRPVLRLFVNFQFFDLVAVVTGITTVDPHIPSVPNGESNRVIPAVGGGRRLHPGPTTAVAGNFHVVRARVLGTPLDDYLAEALAATEIDPQPVLAGRSLIPVSTNVSINRFERAVGAALATRRRGRLVQSQVGGKRRRRTRAKAPDIGGFGQLVSRQGNPFKGQVIPPFDIVAAHLGRVVAMTGGTDRQSGGGGAVGEVGDCVDLARMFDLGQAVVDLLIPQPAPAFIVHILAVGTHILTSLLAGELGPEEVKDALAAGFDRIPLSPRRLAMEGRVVMTGRAGAVVLDRTALVVHIAAVTLAAGGLGRAIGSGRRDLVTMGAITGLRPGGGVMRAVLVAIGADARIIGGGVADGTVAAHLCQRFGMVDLGNRRGMAGLAAAAVQRDGAVTIGTIAGSKLRLPVMIGRQAGIGSMTAGADDAADFGADMAGRAIPELVKIGGMVGRRRPGQSHGPVMTTGAIQSRDIDPNMANSTLAHLIRDGHVVLIDDRGLIAGGMAGSAVQGRRIDVGVTGTAGDAVAGGREVMTLVHRRRPWPGMAPGAFDGGRLGAGMAVEAAPADGETRRMMHFRAAVLGQTVVTGGTGQIGGNDRRMTGDTVIAVIFQIGRGGVMHRPLAVLRLGRVTGRAIKAGGGDAGMAGAALQTIRRGGRMMTLGQRHGVGVFVATGAIDGREGHPAVTNVTGLRGKGGIRMMHGGGAVPRLADMTGGAIEAAADRVDPLVTGTALIVNRRRRGMVHDRRAVQHRLGGMTAFTGAGDDGFLGAAMASHAVVTDILGV